MIILIDNYDSFTYNLYQYLLEFGEKVEVHRNDKIGIDEVEQLNPKCLVISPGPGRPEDAGICPELVRTFDGKIPILGICLGHQVIGMIHGMPIGNASKIFHGKSSLIEHDGKTVFSGIPNPIEVGRYHSLVVQEQNMPEFIEITSKTDDGTVMGLRHKHHLTEGIQFHPESILTPHGKQLLKNFVDLSQS